MTGGTSPASVDMLGYGICFVALQTVCRVDKSVVMGCFVTAARHVDMAVVTIGCLASWAAAQFNGCLYFKAGALVTPVAV